MEVKDIYQKLTGDRPFFDYVITFSAHSTMGAEKPYSHDDEALKIYPEFFGKYDSEEVDSISAKARLTDDMFKKLLERLKDDDLLENTVIIAFGDHYVYTMVDQNRLMQLSDARNKYELSKTPLFIWAEGIEPEVIDKVVNTTDIYPTICNLFGLGNTQYFLGNDIFDDSYEGYAYWPDGSYITAKGRYFADEDVREGSMSEEEIQAMNKLVTERIQINDDILDSDYYGLR